jgi:hypothetical protein
MDIFATLDPDVVTYVVTVNYYRHYFLAAREVLFYEFFNSSDFWHGSDMNVATVIFAV